jgi:hypothetical protein
MRGREPPPLRADARYLVQLGHRVWLLLRRAPKVARMYERVMLD